jgi:galactoside O-acetyltransferase
MFNRNFFLTTEDLKKKGIKCGKNCTIHSTVNVSNLKNLILADNIRIDAFCNLITTKKIFIKSYVHVGSYSLLYANKKIIILEKFSGLSAGTQIYTNTDDYLGNHFYGPFNKDKNSGKSSKIIIGKYAIVGSNSVILPGSQIPEGAIVGALSVVSHKLKSWGIYKGHPAKYIMPRKKIFIRKIILK